MLYLYVVIAITTLVTYLKFRHFGFQLPLFLQRSEEIQKRRTALSLRRDLDSCYALLRGEGLDGMSALESRAGPNQRLVKYFGINNAFTTVDRQYYKAFRARAAKLLSKDASWWKEMALLTRSYAEESARFDDIGIVLFVQQLTLKTTLIAFFGRWNRSPEYGTNNDEDNIKKVSLAINDTWIASKGYVSASILSEAASTWNNASSKELDELLKGASSEDVHTPSNLILPAYETMWRVVLRCFLEVRFRDSGEEANYQARLAAYLSDPKIPTFRTLENGISCQTIVKEALRLYPPTRCIYRQITPSDSPREPRVEAVDVEHLHHDEAIWGRDVLRFRPQRWQAVTAEQEKALIPFGAGRFVCPAKEDYAPRMIALLVAVLVEQFGEGWSLIRQEALEVAEEGPFEAGSEAMEEWTVRR